MLAYIAEKAQELQEKMPNIAYDWVNRDISQKDIAKNRGLVSFLGIDGKNPDNTATSVVRTALYGFDDIGKIAGFLGLVVRNVYDEVAKRHKGEVLSNYNKNSPTSFVNRDKASLKEISNKGVLARGRVPIEDGEKAFAYESSLKYVGWRGINWRKVTGAINSEFHDGKSVRTKRAARNMVDTYKMSI